MPTRTRRPALVATIAVALALPVPAAAEPLRAHSASDFRDSVGVVTHAAYYDTAYGDWPRLVQKLDELGVDHLRDGVYANPDWRDWNERYYRAVELAAGHGKRFSFVTPAARDEAGTLDQVLAVVAGRLRPAVEQLEGPNEYDVFAGGPTWPAELRDHQRELYAKAGADGRLRGVPVVGPSLALGDSGDRLGRLDDVLDAGNIHPYAGGEPPSATHLGAQLEAASRVSGSKPVVATEAGFHNALAAPQGQSPVSEEVAASYLLRTYLEHFRAGIRRTYAYELVDEKPDPVLDPEQHFGLLRNDLSEKPAFAALRRMLALVGRPKPSAPATVDVGLAGDAGPVQRLLLKKSARRYVLTLWQSESEWDTRLRRPLPVPEREARLELPVAAQATIARPARSGDSTRAGHGRELGLGVPADPVLVELEFDVPPVPDAAPATCAKLSARGGVRLRGRDLEARVRRRGSRRNVARLDLCATTSGRAVAEIGVARGRGLGRVLARRKLRVVAGRPLKVDLGWRGGARRLAVRVTHRPDGAARPTVVRGSLPSIASGS